MNYNNTENFEGRQYKYVYISYLTAQARTENISDEKGLNSCQSSTL